MLTIRMDQDLFTAAVLFDDVVGSGRAVICTAADPRDALDEDQLVFLGDVGAHLVRLSPEKAPGDGSIVDLDGAYAEWFEEAGVGAVVVRPDFCVYGAARTVQELPRLVSSLRSALLSVPRIASGPGGRP